MKNSFGIGLIIVLVIMLLACTKEKIITKVTTITKPSLADSLNFVLAGPVGSSKTWRISKVTEINSAGKEVTVGVSICFLDNTFTFTNNAIQDYQCNEGPTKCNSADSVVVEKGNWAFTDDGKSLIVTGIPYSAQNLFTTLGKPFTVDQLADGVLKVSFSFFDSNSHYHLLNLYFHS
jgi:hypothetical protein